MNAICLPRLNHLRPTLESTLLKAVEEAGELARAVLQFLPEDNAGVCPARFQVLLSNISEELMDVAQTCVTMIFVMEEEYKIQVAQLIDSHLEKLHSKGYGFDASGQYTVTTAGCYKYLHLPRLDIPGVTLLTTVCKIQEELGELTQFLGKQAGASGEQVAIPKAEVLTGCVLELLDVAQCCFTMIYILEEKYQVDIQELTARHIAKLQRKGYYGE